MNPEIVVLRIRHEYQVYKLKSCLLIDGISERTKLLGTQHTFFYVFDICQH